MLRLLGVGVLALVLWGTYEYVKGIGTEEATLVCKAATDARDLKDANATITAAAKVRAKTKVLTTANLKVRNDYLQEKRAHADTAAMLDGILRELETVTAAGGDRGASGDTAAGCGADDDPRFCIIAQCSSALVRMDEVVKELSSKTTALQEHARSVCVEPK